MEFRILGPLEVVEQDRPISLGGHKQRTTLAVLLLRPGQVVGVDQLIEALWESDPPRTAEHSVQVYVSELRKALEPTATIVRERTGYVLQPKASTSDVDRFERLAARGRAAMDAGDPVAATDLLRQALGVWRGAALADFAFDDFARGDIYRLEDRRLTVTEDRIDADLSSGRHTDVVAELQGLVDAHPGRERLRAALMLALYRGGRQAEAVQEFHRARARLAEDLGIDPGRELADLATAILAQDPALDLPGPHAPGAAGFPAADPAPEGPMRRIVSLVLAELAVRGPDGEPADPESSASLKTGATLRLELALARHGAEILRREGGSVIGLFGYPRAHEDDALRSVRAAVDARDAIAALDKELGGGGVEVIGRIAVHTGAILTGRADETDGLASEAIRRAQALLARSHTADPVMDAQTLELVRDAIEVEGIELGGEAAAYRLLAVRRGAPGLARRIDSPIVGREEELEELARVFRRVEAERACELLTIYGEAGIGKTRLVDEFVRRLTGPARIMEGRCLAYGDGITYWPIAEAVRAVAGVHDDDDVSAVRDKLATLLPADEARDRTVEGIAQILGVADATPAEGQTRWSIRKLLSALALEEPVVLVVEDVHWAEPTLLDLLESVADWMRDVAIFVVCTARPEILENRAGWGGGRPNASILALGSLPTDAVSTLIGNLVRHPRLDAEAKARIMEAAEGNPLFVEQLVSMLIDEGVLEEVNGSWSLATDLSRMRLPTSLRMLLTARLDRLPGPERTTLGIASVIGRTFDVETIETLTSAAPDDAVPRSIEELVRKDLIRPERTPDGDGFRFRHVLIMNATYEALPKRARAELHEVVADQLEERVGGRSGGYDEIIGDHLARAARYLEELGAAGDHARSLRDRAGRRLATGAARAFGRGDMPAAASLYEAAAALLPAEDPGRLAFLPQLGLAFVEIGRIDEADRAYAEAIESGTSRKDLRVVADANLFRLQLEVGSGRYDELERSVELAHSLIAEGEAAGDDLVQHRAWSALGVRPGSWVERHEATERAMGFAERAADTRGLHENIQMASALLVDGPLPVEDALRVTEDYLRRTADDQVTRAAIIVNARAVLLAMVRRMAEARAEYVEARATFRELGLPLWLAASGTIGAASTELIGGDPAIAEEMLREGIAVLEGMGHRGWWLTPDLQLLALAFLRQGRAEDARPVLAQLGELNDPTDPAGLLHVRALLALADGRPADAVTDLRVAVREVGADSLRSHAEMTLSLAEALRANGELEEARAVGSQALDEFERKGDMVSTDRARAFLVEG